MRFKLFLILLSVLGVQSCAFNYDGDFLDQDYSVAVLGSSGNDRVYDLISQSGNLLIAGSFGASDGDFSEIPVTEEAAFLLWTDQNGLPEDILSINGNGRDSFRKVRVDRDNGFIAAGLTYSESAPFFGDGSGNIFIARISPNRALEWVKTYGGSGFDQVHSVIVTPDMDYLLAGTTTSRDGIFASNGGFSESVFVIRLNREGEPQWVRVFSGNRSEEVRGMHLSPDNNIEVTGFTQSDTGVFENIAINGSNTIFKLSIDLEGNLLDVKGYGGSGEDNLNYSTMLISGELLLAGNTFSADGDFTDRNLDISSAAFFMRIDPEGSISQIMILSGNNFDMATAVATLSGRRFALAGRTQSSRLHPKESNVLLTDRFFITVLDAAGEIEKIISGGGTASDTITSSVRMLSGRVVFAGNTSSTNGDFSENNGGTDIFLVIPEL
ncbi:MAG: hypothetical protein LAT75_08825 [Candidatus Cyclonatronum sp.]|uniref:hypothetical protein n=1 Tax=Cyclonatronum sp. TaxID=3024185 RepID=UPI0025BCED99|nr:hypothetical protein [Cyclonatronum sp.]MCH8486957.1 hypothetical protein [Cyclonatronum sp.]